MDFDKYGKRVPKVIGGGSSGGGSGGGSFDDKKKGSDSIVGPFDCGLYYPKTRFDKTIAGARGLYHTHSLTKNIIYNKRGNPNAAKEICELMYEKLVKIIAKVSPYEEFSHYQLQLDDLRIIPVPAHKYAEQTPALNLVKALLMTIHEKTGKNINCYCDVLLATLPHDPHRKQMSPEARREHDEKKYKITEKIIENNDIIKDAYILLIDDIYVKGSTVGVCSDRLLENGAKRVIQLCAGKSQ